MEIDIDLADTMTNSILMKKNIEQSTKYNKLNNSLDFSSKNEIETINTF